jgi:hypothetical protein
MANNQAMVALRLMGMIASLLGVFSLYKHTVGTQSGTMSDATGTVSVFQTVYSQCILILVSLGYYCVWKACSTLVFQSHQFGMKKKGSSRERDSSPATLVHHPRNNQSLGSESETWSNLSEVKLTIRNVWVLVYGLGFVFFITGYCFLGLQPVCLTFIGLAIGVLSVDELLCPRREFPHWYTLSRFVVLLSTLVSLVLVSAPILDSAVAAYIHTLDVYSMVFGLIFPFCSQFILIIIRDSRRYTLGTVIEVCEFGFPFTAFLGVFHLCVSYGQRYQADSDALSAYHYHVIKKVELSNETVMNDSGKDYMDFRYWYHFNDTMVNSLIETDGPFLTFYSLAPFAMIPAVVCYMSCALDGCAIDPLLSLTFVLCMEHLMVYTSQPSALVIVGTIFCIMGLIVRVVCEYRPIFLCDNPIYSMQGTATQLPHNVVWSRSPTMQDCEAETQELSSDFPEQINA